ncbi:MAG: hypothetical protein DRJ52_06505 [Thermoprotei archaeon]|nr:MAG: hypothetical protein DRJ52_06505 [Thermoprotei archaeon]
MKFKPELRNSYVSKITIAVVIVAIVAIIGITLVYMFSQAGPKYDLKGKKVLIVIFAGYNDIEYSTTKSYLAKCGAEVTVLVMHKGAGTKYDIYVGDIKDINRLADQYDAVVFIGGPGVYSRVIGEIKDGSVEKAAEIATAFYSKGKLVAAICAAPGILAKAGIIKGVKVTCFSDSTLINIIKASGAQYTGQQVVKDKNIITANGPNAAKAFAEEIAKTLSGKT